MVDPDEKAALHSFFTEQEIDRAKRQAALRHSLRQELEPAEKKSDGLGELLRSELSKWLITTLLIGTILPFTWTKMDLFGTERKLGQEKKDAARRDDSKFVADMLPFLTSPQRVVRSRALDVLTTRYDTIPPAIQRLMAHALQDGETLYVAHSVPSHTTEADASTKQILGRFARSLAKIPESKKDPKAKEVIKQIPANALQRIADDTIPSAPLKASLLSFDDIRRGAGQPAGQLIRLIPNQLGQSIRLDLYKGHPIYRGKFKPEQIADRAEEEELPNPGMLQVIDTYETSHRGFKWLHIKTQSHGKPIDAWFSWGEQQYQTVKAG